MDIVNNNGSFVTRTTVSRPIPFERYRKPCIATYPRSAVFLNKRRANELHCSGAPGNENGSDDNASSLAFGEDNGKNEAADDDDPLNIDPETMLCSDEQLKQVLALRWRDVGPNGCGLQNMGNTCFINCVLQAIAYTPALSQYFSTTFRSPHTDRVLNAPFDYAYALGETIRKIHTPSRNAYKPTVIISNIKVLSPHFRLGVQGDAHEFAVHLLHACHRSILFRQVGSRKLPQHIEQTSTLQRIVGGYLRSTVTWSRREEIHYLLKEGNLQEASNLKMNANSRKSDSDDGHKELISNTYDPFVTLSPEICGQTLEHCLSKLCAKERLEGRVYITPRGVTVNATKQFMLHKLPNVLIIHLKRFNEFGAKVGKFVRYPKILNMGPFCTADGTLKKLRNHKRRGYKPSNGPASCDSSIYNSEASNRSVECLYELNAICVHQGSSLSHGHYFSVVRARNESWIECNDGHISHCSEDHALSQSAYMLFYSRVAESSATPDIKCSRDNRTTHRGMELSSGRVKPFTGSTPRKIVGECPTSDVGRELTDQEALRLIGKKREVPQQQLVQTNGEKRVQHVGLPARLKGLNTKSSSSTAVRDNSSNNSLWSEQETCSSSYASSAAFDREENSVCSSRKNSAPDRYCGIVKALKVNGSRDVGKRGTSPTDPLGGHRSSVVGEEVLRAMEKHKLEAPLTVMRQPHAPKFRQQVRDPLWEQEMDRGRTKRSRLKRDESTDEENKFQKADIGFDSRGRRLLNQRNERANGRSFAHGKFS
ncbi:cysteine peptidase, Clan CA, family C19,putative [Trypanosoma brucei gambiense DAL972]|uniref:Ubiquitin carboxyl-terminal hydrolase n=1 Tax=Trypanosoma brucei gambiense (strain MHOM/CI/86/DAL972) TaxID=679716 RepID=D0A726_TRYB9|nr:cysteine peptidase, Clan CA, family C19,putative [Trypanosoma brucei gambiense DAL972]CBH17477.1 cysteine peptidase, Clan CA, family C19,putative [Trypanosoma brucei gambiense DAL972]|eukprot:XP_011779741.1 cysteine peptidase, Clan CA, family C19,putative [Trypanosoma brucei gambiense DAL972]